MKDSLKIMRKERGTFKYFGPISMISRERTYKKFASHGMNKQINCTYLPQVSEEEEKNRILIPRIKEEVLNHSQSFKLQFPKANKSESVSSFRGNEYFFLPFEASRWKVKVSFLSFCIFSSLFGRSQKNSSSELFLLPQHGSNVL